MVQKDRLRVAVNGHGVIGKRVAEAVARQTDMVLTGVAEVAADWRIRVATQHGFRVFGATPAWKLTKVKALGIGLRET